eukprot:9861895-Ditylum_brightwellii.AAC.1
MTGVSEEENSDTKDQATPIKRIKRAFRDADATLQGEIRAIKQAAKRQGWRTKSSKKRKTRRVKWGNKFNSDGKSNDDGEIKTDDNEVYTPINPNINNAERQVYNLYSQNKDKEE